MNNSILEILKPTLKRSRTAKSASGFTLIELLVAAGLTSICIALAGSAVFFITQNNKVAKSETERRVEFNRSLDFLSEEIRQANPVAPDAALDLAALPTAPTVAAVAPNFVLAGKSPVLSLKIPGVTGRVVYYVASKPNSSPWFGPNIVYRWGPKLNNNGQYTNPTNPVAWEHKPLVDSIGDTTPTGLPACSTLSDTDVSPCVDSGTIQCKTGSLNPPSPQGFFACIDPKGQIANLTFRGSVIDAYGKTVESYEANSQAFARPGNTSFSLNTGPDNSGGNGGTATITQKSTAYFEVLGGNIQCGAGGPIIPTETTINITRPGQAAQSSTIPSTPQALSFPTLEPGSTVTVTGRARGNSLLSGCQSYDYSANSQTNNGTQVLTLRNGDTSPLFVPFGTQKPIDEFLTKYLDPVTKKIKLANNQVIYLFELGSTNPSESAYDMQDLVILATITPEED